MIYWVLSGFTGFCRVPLFFFKRILGRFTGFNSSLRICHEFWFYLVLPGFTGCYWVLLWLVRLKRFFSERLTQFYLHWLGCGGFQWFLEDSIDFTGFYRVLLGFDLWFHGIFLNIGRIDRVFMDISEIYWFLLKYFPFFFQDSFGFAWICWVLLGFTGFYWIFTGFYRFLLSFFSKYIRL